MSELQTSKLTAERPDIWQRGLALATSLTGYSYLPKLPNPDGTLWACGVSVPEPPNPFRDLEDNVEERARYKKGLDKFYKIEKHRKDELDGLRDELEKLRKDLDNPRSVNRAKVVYDRIRELEEGKDYHRDDAHEPLSRQHPFGSYDNWNDVLKQKPAWDKRIEELDREIQEIKKKLSLAPTVFVPTGSMEWLLHEVGHWLAARPECREVRNYGLDGPELSVGDDRELQAMAFQQAVLAPWGEAREFVPPLARYGVCFERQGPLAEEHLRHIERCLLDARVDIEPWRIVWGDWVRWGCLQGDRAPWRTEQ